MTVPLLILKSAGFEDGQLELNPKRLPAIIGRSRSADITISDKEMSRRHAEFRMSALGQFELVDLESTNLTIVNTHDVQRHVLRTGDQILLGETEFLVEVYLPRSDLHDQTTKELPRMDSREG